MIVRTYVVLAAAMLALLPISTRASASPDAIAVLNLERAWLKAIANQDPVALGKILDTDFVHVNYKGAVEHRSAMLARIKKPLSFIQTTSEQTVNFVDGVAIVNGVNTIHQGGKVVLRLRYTDTYHRAGTMWRAVWAQETAIAP
jgi:hypothetical protein